MTYILEKASTISRWLNSNGVYTHLKKLSFAKRVLEDDESQANGNNEQLGNVYGSQWRTLDKHTRRNN